MLPALAGRLDRPLHEALYWNWIDKDSDTGWAIRKGRWKLLADKGGIELYDLEADVGETRNQAPNQPMTVQLLLAEYKNWQSQLRPRIRRQR